MLAGGGRGALQAARERERKPLRVMAVMGTRPDTIKMAPVVHALRAARPDVEPIVCVTAQHREMLDEVLRLFEIVPDVDLDIMTRAQSLTDITTRVLTGMERTLAETRPDVVLVHGDTTTLDRGRARRVLPEDPGRARRGGPAHVDDRRAVPRRGEPAPHRRAGDVPLRADVARRRRTCWPSAREHAHVVVTGNTVIDAFLATERRVATRRSRRRRSTGSTRRGR